VGLLRPALLAARPETRTARCGEAFTEVLRDEGMRHRGSLGRDARRIGTHVRDEPRRAFRAEVDPLVELLGDAHRLLGGEAETLRRFLLQRARGEGCGRVLPLLPTLDLGDVERMPLDVGQDLARRRFVLEREGLPIGVRALGAEAVPVLVGPGGDRPALFGDARAELALALDAEAQRGGLDAPGREPGANRLPEERADLIAD